MTDIEKIEKLTNAVEAMADLIRDAEIPEGLVRRILGWELARAIYEQRPFPEDCD